MSKAQLEFNSSLTEPDTALWATQMLTMEGSGHTKIYYQIRLLTLWRTCCLELCCQITVPLSTTEAEYMASSDAAKQAIWLQLLLADLQLNLLDD
jgi:hypothetical protein